ncbi:hypothetical protein EMCRGX_G010564 [Ephydatia muelleri]
MLPLHFEECLAFMDTVNTFTVYNTHSTTSAPTPALQHSCKGEKKIPTAGENHQPHDQAAKLNRDLIAHAISLGRASLFGKACKVLESNGLAPNNDATWQLLQSKHPSCPPRVAPNVNTIPISVGPGFDILSTLRSFPKGTAVGPSGLRIQHLLDAALIPIATPICATLRDIVNLLASGKAPPMVARPIAVGESLRRLTGKCICALVKDKASDLFQPLQLGVACSSGSEKIIHGLRKSIEDYWMEEDIVVFKIDMQNAFNLVSRQAVLDEYATSFPEILPSVTWCYGTRSLLWHQLGHYSLETGKGDFLGPLLFSLAWYLDDGVLTGKCSALLRALSLIEELGPSLGIHINLAKCELFIHFGNSMFPPAVKFSHHPNLEILGASIGDYLYCSNFIAGKSADARKLLSSLVDVAAVDPHVALSLLRLCGSYCRLVHLARATPSSLAGSLKLFDEEVRSNADNVHLQQAIIQFNDQVSTSDAITAEAGLPLWQTELAYYLFRLPMTPSLALGLHLEPNELHASIRKPWIHLGTILPHALMEAHMGVTVEAGYGLTHDNSRSRPADVLVTRWEKGLPAALNITVTSPLNPAILDESCSIAGAAAVAAESRKHVANDPKCFELGWTCVPLAVETYGNWGVEAQETFSRLASLLAASHSVSKSKATADIYVRLNLTLTRYAGSIEDGTCEDYFYLMVCRFQTCEAFNQVNRSIEDGTCEDYFYLMAGSIENGTCEDYFYLMVCRFQTCEAFNQVNRFKLAKPSIKLIVCRFQTCEAFNQVNRFKLAKPSIKLIVCRFQTCEAFNQVNCSIEDGTCEDYFYLMVCRFQTCEAFNQVNRSIQDGTCEDYFYLMVCRFQTCKAFNQVNRSIQDGTCEDYFYLMVCRFQTCEAFNQVNRSIKDGTCEDYFYLMVCRFQTCEAFNQVNRMQVSNLRSLQSSESYAGFKLAKPSIKLIVCRFHSRWNLRRLLLLDGSIDVLWTLRSLQASPLYAGFKPAKPSIKLIVCRFQTCEAFNQVNRMQVSNLRSLQSSESYAGFKLAKPSIKLIVCRFQTCEAFNQVNRSIEDGTCEDYFYLMVCRFQTCEAFNQVNRMQVSNLRSLQSSESYAGFKLAKPSIKLIVCRFQTCEAFNQVNRMQVPLKMEPAKILYLMVCRFQTCEDFNQVNRFIEDGTCEDYFYLMRPLSLYPIFEVNRAYPGFQRGGCLSTVQIRSQLDITNNGEAACTGFWNERCSCDAVQKSYLMALYHDGTPLEESSICLEAKMKGMHNMRLSDTRGPHRLRGL